MIRLILAGSIAASVVLCVPSADVRAEEGDEEVLDAVHHVADGNYMDFSPFGTVGLPRILLVRAVDGTLSLDFFLTTHAALASGKYHLVDESVIAEEEEPVEAVAAPHHDATEPVDASAASGGGHDEGVLMPVQGDLVVDFSITRHLVFAWLGAFLVVLVFVSLARRYNRGVGRESAPRGLFHNMFEALVIFVRNEIARPNLGDKTERFLPYLLTAFFFILFCNLLGLVPFGSTATANISVTAVLAAFTFAVTQFSANRDHWKHLFGPPGTPFLVRFILFPVEFLGLFTKPIALAIRLFANMTAGHLVILSLIGLIFTFTQLFGPAGGYGISPVSIAFSLGIYLLELLVATIQAYIFTMLSALFIGMAVEEHEHHAEEMHHADALVESSSTKVAVGDDFSGKKVEAELVRAS